MQEPDGQYEPTKHEAPGTAGKARQQSLEARYIHGLVQTILHGLTDQRMVGHHDVSHEVLAAGHLIGEYGSEQILSIHAC